MVDGLEVRNSEVEADVLKQKELNDTIKKTRELKLEASISIARVGYSIEIYENEIKSIEVYPTIKIILKSELVDFLLDLLENEKEQYIDIVDDTAIDLNNIKNIIIRSKQEKDGNIYFEIDIINKTRLLQYVMDKQLAIGFVNQDYLNEDGRKLQFIYDEIYYQTN